MARLLSKANLEAHVAASKPGRYACDGLHLAEDGVWSTNGRVLLRTVYPTEKVTEHPLADDRPGPTDVTIPVAAAQKAVKNLTKHHLPVLNHVVVTEDPLRLASGFPDEAMIVTTRPCEVAFPPLDRVKKKYLDRQGTRARFSVTLLKQLVTALEKAGAVDATLDLEADGPIVVVGYADPQGGTVTHEVARGLLMPITEA